MPDQDTATRLARVKSGADWITKIAGATMVVIALLGGLAGALVPFAQDRLGIVDLAGAVEDVQGDVDGVKESIDELGQEIRSGLARLAPRQTVAIYDAPESYQTRDHPCRVGGLCSVRFRLRRTTFGEACGRPELAPFIRNHGGVRHPVELRSGALRVGEEWDVLISRFVIPMEAKPGRATYIVDLEYPCPTGIVREKTIKVAIQIKQPQESGAPL